MNEQELEARYVEFLTKCVDKLSCINQEITKLNNVVDNLCEKVEKLTPVVVGEK